MRPSVRPRLADSRCPSAVSTPSLFQMSHVGVFILDLVLDPLSGAALRGPSCELLTLSPRTADYKTGLFLWTGNLSGGVSPGSLISWFSGSLLVGGASETQVDYSSGLRVCFGSALTTLTPNTPNSILTHETQNSRRHARVSTSLRAHYGESAPEEPRDTCLQTCLLISAS